MQEIDWEKFYDSERYLLDEVGRNFRDTGILDSADFYTILIWKAERAKNQHKKRLKRIVGGSLQDAVSRIASELREAPDGKDRLKALMDGWGFVLPTATAILTFLYPNEFTVFDWRVCDEVKFPYEPWCSRGFSESLWDHYQRFKQTVIDQTPAQLSLRRKDRFLIGRSTRKSVEQDSCD